MVILEENFKWHLEAFASELFIFNSFSIWESLVTVWLSQTMLQKKQDTKNAHNNIFICFHIMHYGFSRKPYNRQCFHPLHFKALWWQWLCPRSGQLAHITRPPDLLLARSGLKCKCIQGRSACSCIQEAVACIAFAYVACAPGMSVVDLVCNNWF